MLNVHEGPQGFGSPVKLEEGMVLTVEPGVYREGEHGIRTENVVEVVKGDDTEYGQMMKFENFTLVPIDVNCLDVSMLTDHEIKWLNYSTPTDEQLVRGIELLGQLAKDVL